MTGIGPKQQRPRGALLATMLLLTLAPVAGPFVDYHAGSIVNPICCAIAVPPFAILCAWDQAFCDLKMAPEKLEQARKRLVNTIEERQAQVLNQTAQAGGRTTPTHSDGKALPCRR
jgi:hypothetical protein